MNIKFRNKKDLLDYLNNVIAHKEFNSMVSVDCDPVYIDASTINDPINKIKSECEVKTIKINVFF